VVAWSPRPRRDRTLKTQLGNIKAGNEYIDDAYKRIWRAIVIDAGRKQAALASICPFHRAHKTLPAITSGAYQFSADP
jgi:hypothetical protein